MADDHQTAAEDEKLDASYKPDVGALDGDEADFAKALGFGLGGSDGAESHATDEASAPVPSQDEGEGEGDEMVAAAPANELPDAEGADTGDDAEAPDDEAQHRASDAAPAEDADAPPSRAAAEGADDEDPDETDAASVEYEVIHPRPASEGIQDTLKARADEVLARREIDVPLMAARDDAAADHDHAARDESVERLRDDLADRDRALAAALADLDATHAELEAARAAREATGGVDEKELEEIRVELESVTLERDQLIDQLAATSGQLVQTRRSAEQLEASLRAARGALVPLPEGERALRAEVIGLRGRLEDASQENVRLTSEVASVATELAIAAARAEDRQHEIDYHADRARDLEQELAEKDRQTEDAIARHREALDLATRLQAENTELRGAQAALEETLQARDLEITAREEHLRVTREGLTTRDTQLVDVKETLEQERHRIEALEADLERAEIEKNVLLEKVAHRESRIATLTNTLGRIEEAMGQRLELRPSAQPVLAQAEWTRPSPPSAAKRAIERVPSGDSEAPAPPIAPIREPALAMPTTPPEADPEPEAPRPQQPAPVLAPEPAVEDAATAAAPAEPVVTRSAIETDADDDLPVARTVAPEPTAAAVAVPAEPEPSAEEPAVPAEPEPSAEEAAFDAFDAEVVVQAELDDPFSEETGPPARILSAAPALPPVLGRWRDDRLLDLEEARADSVADFLAQRLVAHLGEPGPEAVLLRSLGGALPDSEARLVTALHARGVEGIRMDVLDVDEQAAQARRARIERACLGEVIDVHVGDLPDWDAHAPCHAILLADALHAQARPEAVLDHLAPAVAGGALLLFAGRIGSGPVQLSASTLMRLEELWQFLPEPLASAEGLGRPPFRGDDGGAPAPEIDPAAALVERFEATALVGFGHLADLVVGPSRGFAITDEDEDARQLLQSIVAIDESRGITESLPPRHGVGVFAHGSVGRTECYGLPWPCLADALR